MKRVSVLVARAFCLLIAGTSFGEVDRALAQSVCTCPAGTQNLGNGYCQSPPTCSPGYHLAGNVCLPDGSPGHHHDWHHYSGWLPYGWVHWPHSPPPPPPPQPPQVASPSPASCRAALPSVGQIAASQQQSSMAAVAGVLRGRREGMQGGVTAPRFATSALGYAPSAIDGGADVLGYAATASAGQRNPLANGPVAAAHATRFGAESGPTWATWFEGMGDWEKRTALNEYDVGRTQSTYGAHAGVDATWESPLVPGDYVVTGLVTSYSSTHVDLANSARLQLEGPGVGLYAMYLHGGFSADFVTKFDFLRLNEGLAALSLPDAAIGVTSAGVAGNIQYKQKFAWGFIEPTAGFSFSRTLFGSNAAAMGLQDGSTLRLQAGARVGAAFQRYGVSIEPTLGLFAYSNVVADNTSVSTVDVSVPVSPTDKGLVRAEIDPELNFNFDNGYTAYLRGAVRVGGELVGGAAKAGVRKEF